MPHRAVWAAALWALLPAGARAQELALAFRPDGGALATGGPDQVVRLWTAPGGAARGSLHAHLERVTTLAWSPDGSRLASADASGGVLVWRPESSPGSPLRLAGHRGPAHGVAFSADGGTVYSAGQDRTLRAWDATTGESRFMVSPGGPLYAAAAGDRWVAAAGLDGGVHVFDASTGQHVRTLTGHADAVYALTAAPGGRLASAGEDGTARVWDVATGHCLAAMQAREPVRQVSLDAAGRRMCTAGAGGLVVVWDAATGDALFARRGETANAVMAPDVAAIAAGPGDWVEVPERVR